MVPTPDVAPLSAIVDGIEPSIIPWLSSSSSSLSLYLLFSWGLVASTVLANVPLPRRRSNLLFHLSATLFRLRVSVTGVTE